ncbi:GNAT family N-acetyltransferase [Allosphingosinicella indica]|uniref:Putative acetyltransferase n=1 Tax=Allosphingosinicella indica TaxID=941907 RepID=A0A1X7FXL1_9SPHN|nr:GNAT family N-acetyltransferase [Allosphingosinicella indica]SMF60525.1 putative acetyltransferase [Allosphingosinicella indica]
MRRRRARPDDIAAVHAIYVDGSVIPYLGHDSMPLADFRPIFDRMLDDGDLHVIEIDRTVAGFCKTGRQHGRCAHVAHLGPLAIASAFQGRGAGRAMVAEVIAELEAAGVTRIELQAEADNRGGLAFYERMGFHREGVQRFAYKRGSEDAPVDEVMMVRFVGPLAVHNPNFPDDATETPR